MTPFNDGPMARRVDFIESAGRSVGRSGEFDTAGCAAEAGYEFNGQCLVPAVSLRAITSRGKAGSAEVMVHGEAAGDVGAFLVEAFCRQASPEAREALLLRLNAICSGGPDPDRQPAPAFRP
jgi:hypothetical protein